MASPKACARASARDLDHSFHADPPTTAYRDLAVLRRVLLAGTDSALADRRAALQGIAVAGRPYRTLAEEQLAYLLVEEGKTDEAIAAMITLLQDQEATGGLRARLTQMVKVLGGTLPDQAAG